MLYLFTGIEHFKLQSGFIDALYICSVKGFENNRNICKKLKYVFYLLFALVFGK